MRSTEDWSDVRYRDYTTSLARAEAHRLIPKLRFTDSNHGVVPVVAEHPGGKRLKVVHDLAQYVREHAKGGKK
jgi:hypothetical protein